MSDLISRKALLEKVGEIEIKHWVDNYGRYNPFIKTEKIIVCIEDAPPVEAVPVVHGEWMKRVRSNNGYVASITCSVCGYAHSRVTYNFCPECGADMRKGGAKNV